MKDKEYLIKCPFCERTDFIYERETPIFIVRSIGGRLLGRNYKYFCGNCIKDFNEK